MDYLSNVFFVDLKSMMTATIWQSFIMGSYEKMKKNMQLNNIT